MTSPHLTDQQLVARECPFESGGRLRRTQDRFGKGALSGERQSNDARFLDGPIRRLPCRADDEFADAPALDLGGALDDLQSIGRDSRFDARGAGGLLWHWFFLSSWRMYGKMPGVSRARVGANSCGITHY